MAKTLEQIVLEGLAGDCCSMEELFVLWQTTQMLEENAYGRTCYESRPVCRRFIYIKRTQFKALPSKRTDVSGSDGCTEGVPQLPEGV